MTKRLNTLDSLRGLAAIIVVFHHFMIFNDEKISQMVSSGCFVFFQYVSELNTEAVMFFFVLSGFSIGLAQKGKLIADQLALNHYLYKRFKRILPIYWCALLITLSIGLIIKEPIVGDYGFFNLLGNLLFLQTPKYATDYWFSPYGKNGPLWSLSFEMFFYFFFPLLCFTIGRLKWIYINRNTIFLTLLVLSISAIVFNKYIAFVPILSFIVFFVVWWGGFRIAVHYLKKEKDTVFWLSLLIISGAILSFKNDLPSASLFELTKALFISACFYFLLELNRIWHSNIKSSSKTIFNFMFNTTGHGSFALYAFHYPILMLFDYYSLEIWIQVCCVLIIINFCYIIERWFILQDFKFLRINYIHIKNSKVF